MLLDMAITVLYNADGAEAVAQSSGMEVTMPKQSPVPDVLSKPFWDACNEGRLIVQKCKACTERRGFNVMQHPPEKACVNCGSDQSLVWQQVSGRGKIHAYCVMHDSRIRVSQADQPFNIAIIELEEDPSVLFYSNLPGVPVDAVPVGADVLVEFEATPATGQKVPEWRVVR